jgi:AcrR family transcriptional regulator
MPSTLRQEQQAATRERLLRASYEAFIDRGFDATTIDQIVKSAGTSRATFYLHFRSKAEALAQTWTDLDLPAIEALMRDRDDAGDFSAAATRTWLGRMLDYWNKHEAISTAADQAMTVEPDLRRTWVRNIARIVEAMPQLHAAMGGDQAAADAMTLKAVELERSVFFWVRGDLELDRERMLAALVPAWSVE